MRTQYAVLMVFSLLLLSACDGRRDEVVSRARAPRMAAAVGDQDLDNAHFLTSKVLTGAQPHGEKSFALLQRLGVKTVISVDGAKPDVAAAEKYGLRYVHLPMGYDSVNGTTAAALAKAIQELPAPLYIHCHHGKHRGPAAAAVACVIAGELTNDEAVAAMHTLGTGENYKGLWASARNAQRADRKELKSLKVNYRAVSAVPPLAEAMVEVDERMDHLKLAQQAGWRAPKDNPDLDPVHDALQLREILIEIDRTEAHLQRPQKYQVLMDWTIEELNNFEAALLALKQKPPEPAALETLNTAFGRVTQNCKTCHNLYRD